MKSNKKVLIEDINNCYKGTVNQEKIIENSTIIKLPENLEKDVEKIDYLLLFSKVVCVLAIIFLIAVVWLYYAMKDDFKYGLNTDDIKSVAYFIS